MCVRLWLMSAPINEERLTGPPPSSFSSVSVIGNALRLRRCVYRSWGWAIMRDQECEFAQSVGQAIKYDAIKQGIAVAKVVRDVVLSSRPN